MKFLRLLSLSVLAFSALAVMDEDDGVMDVHIVRKYDRAPIERADKTVGGGKGGGKGGKVGKAFNLRGDVEVSPRKSMPIRRSVSVRQAAEADEISAAAASASDTEQTHKEQERLLVEAEEVTTWNGLGVGGGAPSDACGAVGPSHYFQVVNNRYAIYSKTGTLLSGPNSGNSMFAAFSGSTAGAVACRTATNGDPTVQYDKMAQRWIFTEFAWTAANDATGPYFQCVAVSKTSDPMGQYYYYAFEGRDGSNNVAFPDYGKMSIWPDAYYITYVLFTDVYVGPQVSDGTKPFILVTNGRFFSSLKIQYACWWQCRPLLRHIGCRRRPFVRWRY
jgi:hypothetical protein